MTALAELAAEYREDVEQRLTSLVAARLNDEWAGRHDRDLSNLAHPALSLQDVEELFEELCRCVRLRDGVNDGLTHWSEVDDSITGPDPSTAAYDLACGWVDDAVTSLIGGRR